ncbi:MAG TPA: methyltransferase domain-containing protein [Thermotogota bacterium]|nr:methyltransferase domain-containing protein [Thermotogota bacterium]HPJ88395.1 methyltransferase domain-containing protein [Thermotogota bacterium]HPR95438.1 methyltransferase domain-containing protein [Thermotogota bacterium]
MIKQIKLVSHISRRISNGHPYIYENEIADVKGDIRKGEIVDVFTYSGQFVGKGYYNASSKIRVRLLTRQNERIDRHFVAEKLIRAFHFRQAVFGDKKIYRVFNGLADGIAGLKCDRFDDLFIVSSSTAGGDLLLPEFISVLKELGAENIVIRNLSSSRKKEDIENRIEVVCGLIDKQYRFGLNGVEYRLFPFSEADSVFYLEQRENSVILADYARRLLPGKKNTIYDFFCGYGQFGFNLLKENLGMVEFVDSGETFDEIIEGTASENGFKNFAFSNYNAFDYLHRLDIEGQRADLIVLDPPPFTDARRKKGRALNAYKEINLRALKILRTGGILATSCCSQNVSKEELEMMFYAIAGDIRHELTILHRGSQPLDFPVKINIFETEFLKFYIIMKGAVI